MKFITSIALTYIFNETIIVRSVSYCHVLQSSSLLNNLDQTEVFFPNCAQTWPGSYYVGSKLNFVVGFPR